MSSRLAFPVFLATFALPPTAVEAAPVSFRNEIAPVLIEHCQTCHGPAEQRGGYRLDTFDFLSRNEDPATPVLTPRNPEKSSLFHLLTASDADERMPKKAPPLAAAMQEKIRQWIAEGALFDGDDRNAPIVEIVPPKTHPPAPTAYRAPLPVSAIAFSPDGKKILVGGLREILVRDAASGKLLQRIENASPRTFDIVLHPDGASFITAGGTPGESGEVRQFDLASGRFMRQLAAASDVFLDLEITPDGKTLVLAGADHSLSLLEMTSARRTHRLNAHADAVTGLAMSADGKRFASVGLDRIAKVYDTETGKLMNTYREHQSGLFSIRFLSPDELLTAGRDKSLHAWKQADVKKGRELGGLGDIFRTAYDGTFIYVGGSSGKVVQASADKLAVQRTFEGLSDWVGAIAIHRDSETLAAGSHDGTLVTWSTKDGSLRFKQPAHGTSP
jgi:WD40 repeat protein